MATQVAFTVEQLARMPENGVRHEIDRGELIEMTRPNSRHGRLQVRLSALLYNYVEARKLGEVYSETGFILSSEPDTLRGPDIAFVRSERIPQVPEQGWPRLGPDLVVEIVSPSETARQIDRKVHQYLAAGTMAVWVIYPDTQSVHVFEPNGVARGVEGSAVLASDAALAGFEIRAGDIFA
jgi:Uma2 family endonuclease